MNKMVLMFGLLLYAIPGVANGQTMDNWHSNFADAQELAQKNNKHLLLYFSGSDWCRPCMKLSKDVIETSDFQTFISNKVIAIQLDFPAQEKNQLSADQLAHNEALAEKYNDKGSFPLLVVLDANGKKIGQISGYQNEGSEKILALLEGYIN
jgi:thioredoxin-related protein